MGLVPLQSRFKKLGPSLPISYILSDKWESFSAAHAVSCGFELGYPLPTSNTIEWTGKVQNAVYYKQLASASYRQLTGVARVNFFNRRLPAYDPPTPPEDSKHYWDMITKPGLVGSRAYLLEVMDVISHREIVRELVKDGISIYFKDEASREMSIPLALEAFDVQQALRPLADYRGDFDQDLVGRTPVHAGQAVQADPARHSSPPKNIQESMLARSWCRRWTTRRTKVLSISCPWLRSEKEDSALGAVAYWGLRKCTAYANYRAKIDVA